VITGKREASTRMSRIRVPLAGVIAEDHSDVDSVKILIQRITGISKVGTKRRVGKGCGKIKRKCNAWASQMRDCGCSLLILLHDLDNRDIAELRQQIEQSLDPCPIARRLICIPVQEYEAWLLSDPSAIKDCMNLKKTPRVSGLPESIDSPKEYLGERIRTASDGERLYINTKHNVLISKGVCIDTIAKRCPSFIPFLQFVRDSYKVP
jgi:hypothetical protein